MIKTNNFNKTKFWLARLHFVSLMFALFYFLFLKNDENQFVELSIMLVFALLVFLTNQVDEIQINDEQIIFETRSLIPFLASHAKVEFNEIKSIAIKSDQTTNEKGFLMMHKQNRTILEMQLKSGDNVRIPDKVHPKGVHFLKEFIESKMSHNSK